MHKKLDVFSLKKGAIAGIVTGIVVFSVFFVPISMILVIPLIQSNSTTLIEAEELISNMNMIMIGSIELHAVFGIVMGVFFAIAIQHESKKLVPQATVT